MFPNKKPTFGEIPQTNLFSSQADPSTTEATTQPSLTPTFSSFASFSQSQTPLFGETSTPTPIFPFGNKPRASADEMAPTDIDSTNLFATTSSDKTPSSILESGSFGKIQSFSPPAAQSLFSKPSFQSPNLFGQTTSASGEKSTPSSMSSAASLFVPSTSSSHFLASTKPVFSGSTLSKSSPNSEKGNREKEVKPIFSVSSNPFSFKASNIPNPKSLFGPTIKTTGTLYKSSIDSPFSFVKKPETIESEAKDTTRKLDSATVENKPLKIDKMEKKPEVEVASPKEHDIPPNLGPRLGVKQRIGTRPIAEAVSPAKLDEDATEITPEKVKVASSAELRKYQSILLKPVPKELNNRILMKKHFSSFGKVSYVKCNLKREHCIVSFINHEFAAKAKKLGGLIDDRHGPIPIFYTTEQTQRRKSSASDTDSKTSSRVSAVDEELKAMGASSDAPKLIKRRLSKTTGSFKLAPQDRTSRQPARKTKAASTTENIPAPLPPKSKMDPEPLVMLLHLATTSNGDRFRVLDARDKLMRMKITKQSDITTAKAIRGTCPDMCPEKERYSRADKFCLSGFEMSQREGQSVMDPKRVLKEYSRSSADQEEPLSHELRPSNILQLTMDYLLCNNMDHPDTAMVGEWYDFIWNRTRAIRKDVTQQHLCDLTSVSLVEKCARFHIHCSEVLSEEDVAVFDPKINNENLTKCLQTLKHFYTDLEEKEINCPNEAEFRAYEILLNLNESDIASQVQTLRKEIRKSRPVIFANAVFQAINNHNYVRFFALLKKATYLEACIMHRYFTQIRTKALKVILKVYRQPSQFSFEECIRILAFESPTEVLQFCNWLQLKVEDNWISLNKASQGMTEGSLPIFRSRKFIESKRTCLVGEIVNGCLLPPNPKDTYVPHDSFDSNGILKEVAYNALDQEIKKPQPQQLDNQFVQPQPQPPVVAPGFTFAPQTMFLNVQKSLDSSETAESTSKQFPLQASLPPPVTPKPTLQPEEINKLALENCGSIISETSNILVKEVAQETVIELQIHDAATKLLLETTGELTRTVAVELIKEFQREKECRERDEREDRVSLILNEILVEEVIQKETTIVALLIHSRMREDMLQRIAMDLSVDIISETVEEILSDLGESVRQQEQNWKMKVKLFLEKKALQRSKKYFLRWKKICTQRKTLDFVRRTFPSGPIFHLDSFRSLRISDHPKSILDVKSMKEEVLNHTNCGLYVKLLQDRFIEEPLDLFKIIGATLIEKYDLTPRFVPFKIVYLLPNIDQTSQQEFADWLSVKFVFKKPVKSKSHQRVKMTSVTYSKPIGQSTVGISSLVLGKHCNKSRYEKKELFLGLSCVILFYDVLEDDMDTCRECLESLFANKPKYPPLPVAICLLNYTNKNKHVRYELEAMLNELNEFVSSYIIKWIDFDHDVERFNLNLEETLLWLAENSVAQPVLSNIYLRDFLEEGLRRFFFDSVFTDLANKQRLMKTLHIQAPDTIACLYNSVVEHLANVVCDSDLADHSWPAPEFITNVLCYSVDWNKPDSLVKVKNLVHSLTIDECCFQELDYLNPESVFLVASSIFGASDHAVWTGINDLLAQHRDGFVPWAEIFVIIVRHKLGRLHFCDEKGNELTVHYDEQDFDDFSPPNRWLEANRDSTCEFLNSRAEGVIKRPMTQENLGFFKMSPDKNAIEIDRKILSLETTVLNEREESKNFLQKLLNITGDFDPDIVDLDVNCLQSPDAKHTLSFEYEYSNKKPRFELSGYLDDDLSEFSNILKAEKKANNDFRDKLDSLLAND